MSDTPEPMAYIARKSCGCFVWAGVDTPNRANDNAKEMKWCMKQGYSIERVTCQFVRENWRSSCEACRPHATLQAEMAL